VSRTSSDQNSAPVNSAVTNQNVAIHTLLASDEVENIDLAVHDYLAQLGENFMDLTILGLGPDGHVASLFPGAAQIDRLEKVIAITDSPKPPAVRASFTMSMINASTIIWIIAAGASKAEAVTKIIEGDLSIPASYVRAVDHTRLIVDTDAFFTE
jgi:6-phosphogluconolactonase